MAVRTWGRARGLPRRGVCFDYLDGRALAPGAGQGALEVLPQQLGQRGHVRVTLAVVVFLGEEQQAAEVDAVPRAGQEPVRAQEEGVGVGVFAALHVVR